MTPNVDFCLQIHHQSFYWPLFEIYHLWFIPILSIFCIKRPTVLYCFYFFLPVLIVTFTSDNTDTRTYTHARGSKNLLLSLHPVTSTVDVFQKVNAVHEIHIFIVVKFHRVAITVTYVEFSMSWRQKRMACPFQFILRFRLFTFLAPYCSVQILALNGAFSA